MLQQPQQLEAGTGRVSAASQGKDVRQMVLALTLLLIALLVVVVKNRELWLGADETPATEDASPVWVPTQVAQQPVAPVVPVAPIAKAASHVSSKSVRNAARPGATASVVATDRTVLPSMGIEVVAGGAHHAASNSLKVETLSNSAARESTPAADHVRMASAREQVASEAIAAPYPLLAQQMKVQGSVLLQVLIGADGVVRDLRVLSGPAILSSAAREAVREWRFKPYVQNGRAVETSANVTVNFTIKVLDKPAHEAPSTVALVTNGD